MVRFCCDIQDAILGDDVASLKKALVGLGDTIKATADAFGELSALPESDSFSDPIEWAPMTNVVIDRRFAVAGAWFRQPQTSLICSVCSDAVEEASSSNSWTSRDGLLK